MTQIKSPLRYPGGKTRAIKHIKQFFPQTFKEYREPFAGGASIAFYIQQNYSPEKIVVNDLNIELYSFWQTVKDDCDKLCTTIRGIRSAYKDGRQLYDMLVDRRHKLITTFDKAVDFFILNRITYSGLTDSGGYSNGAFIGRFTESSIDRIHKAHKVVKYFTIQNDDFETLVTESGDNVFIYLDPPYYSQENSLLYGKDGNLHKGFDHVRLFDVLSQSGHKWLLSYDDSPYIRDLYSNYSQCSWSLQYGVNNHSETGAKRGKELLISN